MWHESHEHVLKKKAVRWDASSWANVQELALFPTVPWFLTFHCKWHAARYKPDPRYFMTVQSPVDLFVPGRHTTDATRHLYEPQLRIPSEVPAIEGETWETWRDMRDNIQRIQRAFWSCTLLAEMTEVRQGRLGDGANVILWCLSQPLANRSSSEKHERQCARQPSLVRWLSVASIATQVRLHQSLPLLHRRKFVEPAGCKWSQAFSNRTTSTWPGLSPKPTAASVSDPKWFPSPPFSTLQLKDVERRTLGIVWHHKLYDIVILYGSLFLISTY
jgi:hypothetical protein